MKRFVGICIACALISGCAAPTDNRGAPQPFPGYDGQTINVIINYAARGNTDLQAQAILRHLKRHIPGSPKFEFEYSSGNGGLVGANFLGNEGRRNGLTMGIFTIPVMAQVMRAPELRVDFRNFEIADSIAEQTISHIRVDAIPGKKIKSYKDILYTKHAIRTGGHGPNSSKDLRARLVLEVLKIPQKHVTRYRSGGRIRAAIRKDELDMSADSLLGYYGRVASQLIDTGISVPLWHMGHLTLDGNLKCSHTVPKEIPCFIMRRQSR